MNTKKKDKTYLIILVSAAVVIILSAAICLYIGGKLIVKTDAPVYQTQERGEFVSYVIPSEDKIYRVGEEVSLCVCAKNGSSAYALIAGKKIPLSFSKDNGNGYSLFSGSYQLVSEAGVDSQYGSVAFFVTNSGITQIFYGGKISFESAASPSQQGSRQKINTGDGKAKALIVTGMLTEGKAVTENELKFNPEYGNLVRGMSDYVTGRLIDFDDDGNEVEFYKLMSGRAVKADDNVTLVDANSVMTYNSAEISCQPSSAGKIIIKSNMNVPYRLRYVGQSFQKGYGALNYNAKPFTATAIDFIFEYTASFTGSLSSFKDEIMAGIDVSLNPDDKTMILHCRLKRPGKFYGYTMEYDENGNLCLSFRQPIKTLKGMNVIIDPGHGGNPGAVDYTGKYSEAEQTLKISKHLAAYLAAEGVNVYMTRTTDTEVSLEERRLMNQQIKPDLFISIHLNGAENKSRSGTSTYYFTPFSQPFASCINNRLVKVFSESCYKNNPDMLKKVNGADKYYPFFVTRTDICPSVLVEVGFFTHELESKYLLDSAYQQVFGKEIAEAVKDFVKQS